jgi:hypothetical protein
MTKQKNWGRVAGLTLHAVVGGVMVLAGAPKLLGLAPAEHVAQMGLTDHIRLIGAGEMITGVLLLVPRTSSLGILLTSSFWGGAICVHMSHSQAYVIPSLLLVLSWAGAYLRNPATFASFARRPEVARKGAGEAEVVFRGQPRIAGELQGER